MVPQVSQLCLNFFFSSANRFLVLQLHQLCLYRSVLGQVLCGASGVPALSRVFFFLSWANRSVVLQVHYLCLYWFVLGQTLHGA